MSIIACHLPKKYPETFDAIIAKYMFNQINSDKFAINTLLSYDWTFWADWSNRIWWTFMALINFIIRAIKYLKLDRFQNTEWYDKPSLFLLWSVLVVQFWTESLLDPLPAVSFGSLPWQHPSPVSLVLREVWHALAAAPKTLSARF